ncbi:MAG: 3,4-dihydroxy-2-butanone-4-phosphate synthase [Solirubrobacterales bacterium]|nr:3,4-dihydroxy-2-butanone-4-phosphate synthase [Solirubrobacterales bacterium]
MPVAECRLDRHRLASLVWDGEEVGGERRAGLAHRATRWTRDTTVDLRGLSSTWQVDAAERKLTGAVRDALGQLRDGGLVALYDDERDEGDLIAAARLTTPAIVNTMVRRAGGLVSVALTPERAGQLALQTLPVRRSGGRRLCERTPTMVSVEARRGVSTGISAADRARTISILAEPANRADELVSPGHVFPLLAAAGGLHERCGRLEAAVDVMRLAGLEPAAAMCDVLDREGELANGTELLAAAEQLQIPLVAISQIAQTRREEAWSRC